MKTKSLKTGDYAGTGKVLLGALAGALVSRALVTAVHDPASTNAILKGHLQAKRIAIAGCGFVGASIVDGKDDMSLIVKGMGYGASLMQSVDSVKELTATKVADSGTKANRIMRGALGLGCPSETPVWGGMGRTKVRRKYLGFVMPNNAGQSDVVFATSENVQI